MQATQTQLLRLSQGQLNLIETCPRKFQHIYFDQLGSPTNPDQQERQNWGSRFHLLMQQRELGLPIGSLVEEDPQLERWVTALVSTAPEIFTLNPDSFRESEHSRTLSFQGYLLTVIYDLLILDPEQAQILDWKTYPQPRQKDWLARDWQTRLYLYVLAETSDYLPEKISMSYWFVQSKPEPKSLKFTYSAKQHEQTKKDLTQLLNQLTIWIDRYQNHGEDFPQVSQTSNSCTKCNFIVRCERNLDNQEIETSGDLVPDLANIQEISI